MKPSRPSKTLGIDRKNTTILLFIRDAAYYSFFALLTGCGLGLLHRLPLFHAAILLALFLFVFDKAHDKVLELQKETILGQAEQKADELIKEAQATSEAKIKEAKQILEQAKEKHAELVRWQQNLKDALNVLTRRIRQMETLIKTVKRRHISHLSNLTAYRLDPGRVFREMKVANRNLIYLHDFIQSAEADRDYYEKLRQMIEKKIQDSSGIPLI